MGFPPPPDGPPLAAQQQGLVDAGFSEGPPLATLCGFTVPSFRFGIGFHLPPLDFPPPLPEFGISAGLNCSLSNPLDVTAGLEPGGGRVASFDPDPDASLDAATS